MTERTQAEVKLVRERYPDLEVREDDLWARLPAYPLPEGWGRNTAEVAFVFPPDPFGQAPYGFWVRPPLTLPGGSPPSNTAPPVETVFGENWQQFSWSPQAWSPGPDPRSGTNMLDFVRSFSDRLREVN